MLALYAANQDFIRPESRRNEVVRFVEGGLKDLSISRTSFDWGVPVPGSNSHVMYVWLDALTNYITVAGYAEDPDRFARMWPANIHSIGKDILRFHAVYWPAMLMAAGIEPPMQVWAHGYLTVGGKKISYPTPPTPSTIRSSSFWRRRPESVAIIQALPRARGR